jgi:DNA polymerase-3 subunit alpha
MANFVHLHLHSTKSRLDGWGTEEQIIERIVELRMNAVAITDHGNVCAHVPLAKAAKKHGVKAIFGCEFYIVDDHKGPKKQETPGVDGLPHVTVLAHSQEGYRNLLKLSSISWLEGFLQYPRIDWPLLAKHAKGLTVLSGCVGGTVSRICYNEGKDAAKRFVTQWADAITANDGRFYVELNPCPTSPDGFDRSALTLVPLVEIAQELGLGLVVTPDAHFPRPTDYVLQDLGVAIGIKQPLHAKGRFKLPAWASICDAKTVYERCYQTQPDLRRFDALIQDAVMTTPRQIAANCDVTLPKAKPLRFHGTKPGDDSDDLLCEEMKAGLIRRLVAGLIPPERIVEYRERCFREYGVLVKKGFSDYILIVADIIREIKRQGAVVLTRGSAGGSCLLWALGASMTDPILHDLSFERFFDENRTDPPDVDIDFPPMYRQAAIDYVVAKYGRDKTAQLGAFGTFQTRAAVKAIARALCLSAGEVAPLLAELSSADDDVEAQLHALTDPKAQAVLERHPELKLADKFIGQLQNQGMHACGIIISPEPLNQFFGLMRGKKDNDGEPVIVASVDKRGAKDLGHLKMDLLSVVGLNIAAKALELMKVTPDFLEEIPLDDAATLKAASNRLLAGVFQLDGDAARRVSQQIGLHTFDDLAVASAICRPGPALMAPIYGGNKRNPVHLERYLSDLHPIAREVVRPTFGLLIYQEQVMRLAREMAGLDWPDVQRLRKEVSDKLGTQPDEEKREAWKAEWRERFVGGCVRQGVPAAEAERWWAQIQTHGGYSFNKSHAVTYALLSYWMLWLKVHHRDSYFTAYLELERDPLTRKRLIREFIAFGGTVVALDPKHSRVYSRLIAPGVIAGGFADLHGYGEAKCRKFVREGGYEDWASLLAEVPPALKRDLLLSGLPDGPEATIPQALAALAPWFPVRCLPAAEVARRERHGMLLCREMPREPEGVMVEGFITVRDVTSKHLGFALEDESGFVPVRIAERKLARLGPSFRSLQIGDLVIVKGWWSGDTLYADEHFMVKAYEKPAPITRRKKP